MKIYKTPGCMVFDTEEPNLIEFNTEYRSKHLLALHNYLGTKESEFDFLMRNFQKDNDFEHPAMSYFPQSYYHIISTDGDKED